MVYQLFPLLTVTCSCGQFPVANWVCDSAAVMNGVPDFFAVDTFLSPFLDVRVLQ